MKKIAVGTRGLYALVDNEDYPIVAKHEWFLNSRGYAVGKVDGRMVLMHRLIMRPSRNLVIDHINHKQLDNRRSNLRICTHSQNQQNRLIAKNNTSGYTGITRFRHKWRAEYFGKYIGVFDTVAEAKKARLAFL